MNNCDLSKILSGVIVAFSIISMLLINMSWFALLTKAELAEGFEEPRKYFYHAVNTGKDNGFSGNEEITKDDPHVNWKLGKFCISGYSRVMDEKENEDNPIFLKTAGDNVRLSFILEQDIDRLNGNENLSIYSDENGYDEKFDINEKMNFGRGMLIVKHTDYQNSENVTPYSNYLSALTVGADTDIELCEEGDYEVTLDYEIRNNPRKIGSLNIFPTYTNYKILFKFRVRNGTCAIFPRDVKTKNELTEKAMTENGFYVDPAESKYLTFDVKKQILTENGDELIEDTRFTDPSKAGKQYTQEGVYIITVTNEYTNEKVTKQVYVGSNKILKAYAASGFKTSIKQINHLIAQGAEITDDGEIIEPTTEEITDAPAETEIETTVTEEESEQKSPIVPIVGGIAVIGIIIAVIKKKNS